MNLWVVFALCGFWHGASLNFLLWGMYHGLFLVLERMFRGRGMKLRIIGHAYTLLVVIFGWVLFRAETWAQTWAFWKAMCGWGASLPGGSEVWLWFGNDVRLAMAVGMLFSCPVLAWAANRSTGWFTAGRSAEPNPAWRIAWSWVRLVVLVLLFLACVPLLVADTYNPFIYFRF